MRVSRKYPTWLSVLLASVMLVANTLTMSAQAAEEKPFAEKKVVLQISDMDPSKQTLVLNVATNLIKHYGPDKIDIEIVAFGPGLRLMFADNVNVGRIDGLDKNGVRFAACSNTIKKMTKLLGEEPALNSHAVHVDAGVVRIMDLVDQGYTLVKP
jgi:intracellular sulfur oxidation DsrE/DsrF family protein